MHVFIKGPKHAEGTLCNVFINYRKVDNLENNVFVWVLYIQITSFFLLFAIILISFAFSDVRRMAKSMGHWLAQSRCPLAQIQPRARLVQGC